ncbi:hypothetical protein [Indioceanicola profundi]|uniref:hypothetical protein n=1 Tax=Indioceanicola profundi TaxID=2220096 RepID=UPI000E6ADA47|nr:hypothetical protein [Indioceanicola profundi]
MTGLKAPFQNCTESAELAGLTLENGTDRIAIYGNADITRDKAGLAKILALQAAIQAIAVCLEAEKDRLPDHVDGPDEPTGVKNPFV